VPPRTTDVSLRIPEGAACQIRIQAEGPSMNYPYPIPRTVMDCPYARLSVRHLTGL